MTKTEYNRIDASLEYLDKASETMKSGRIQKGIVELDAAISIIRTMHKMAANKRGVTK